MAERRYSTLYKAYLRWLKENKLLSLFKRHFEMCRKRELEFNHNVSHIAYLLCDKDIFSYDSLTTIAAMDDLNELLTSMSCWLYAYNINKPQPYMTNMWLFSSWYSSKLKFYDNTLHKEMKKQRREYLKEIKRKNDENINIPFYSKIFKNSFYGKYGSNKIRHRR